MRGDGCPHTDILALFQSRPLARFPHVEVHGGGRCPAALDNLESRPYIFWKILLKMVFSSEWEQRMCTVTVLIKPNAEGHLS